MLAWNMDNCALLIMLCKPVHIGNATWLICSFYSKKKKTIKKGENGLKYKKWILFCIYIFTCYFEKKRKISQDQVGPCFKKLKNNHLSLRTNPKLILSSPPPNIIMMINYLLLFIKFWWSHIVVFALFSI